MSKLIVDGAEYDFDFDFSVGEARLIYKWSGVTLDKLSENKSNPDLTAALIFVAFRRRWPDATGADLEKRVDKVKLAALDIREEDEVVLPPESARSAQNGSGSASGASSGSGAETSPESETPATTGLQA